MLSLDVLTACINYLTVLDSKFKLRGNYLVNLAAACEFVACFLQLVLTVLECLNDLCSIAGYPLDTDNVLIAVVNLYEVLIAAVCFDD